MCLVRLLLQVQVVLAHLLAVVGLVVAVVVVAETS
jgi:hypothetical protein